MIDVSFVDRQVGGHGGWRVWNMVGHHPKGRNGPLPDSNVAVLACFLLIFLS